MLRVMDRLDTGLILEVIDWDEVDNMGTSTSTHKHRIMCANTKRISENYYDYQLSKARGKFGYEVLALKLWCCCRQLTSFPLVTIGTFSIDPSWKATVTGSKIFQLNMSMRMRVNYSLSPLRRRLLFTTGKSLG